MLCDKCGARQATTRMTIIRDGHRQTLNLCSVCAAQMRGGYDSFGGFSLFDNFFNDLVGDFDQGEAGLGPIPRTPRGRVRHVDITEYFSEETKKVLAKAVETAQHYGSTVLNTEHLLFALLDNEVVAEVIKSAKSDPEALKKIIEEELDKVKKAALDEKQMPELSPRTKLVFELAFRESQELGKSYVGPEHLLLALIREEEGLAAQILRKAGLSHTKVRTAVLKKVGKKGEIKTTSNTPTLDKYSRDLTTEARAGKLDPVIGREEEIETVIEILSRRTKNNPVLVGEPGVGKTAIVEGLAQRIVQGEVPESLQDKRVVALDVGSIVAGTRYRGEFEERFKKILDEIVKNSNKLIIFIDEIHTLVGAGGAEGAVDASNMIKPALARGDLHLIGATTLDEYRKYIEKDAALERRFQMVLVKEPTVEQTIEILNGLKDKYEAHHRVKITPEAIVAAAELSDRYIQSRYLPDKAIDLIDQAAAMVRLRATTKPKQVHKIDKDLERLKRELESASSKRDYGKAEELKQQIKKKEQEREKLLEEWHKQKGTNVSMVTVEDVASIVAKLTGIPVKQLTQEEQEKLLKLEEIMHERIVGQDEAVKAVAEAIRRARAGLKDPNRPIGSFLFLGPTGVGKTELAKTLAEVLFGSQEHMIRIDMSEFMEKHTVSRLIGAPPGYVGYEEGGKLTEAVRRQPYAVILLDEIEKAHSDVFNILLQILDDGRLTDNQGRTVDFKNTIIIATSNLGSSLIKEYADKPEKFDELKDQLMGLLKSYFRPEFLNRIDEIIVFHTLSAPQIQEIVKLLLERTRRLLHSQGIKLEVSQAAVTALATQGFDPTFGARPLRRVIQKEIENVISKKLIEGEFKKGDTIWVDYKNGKYVFSKKGKKTSNKMKNLKT